MAPPMIKTAPSSCMPVKCSLRKKAENIRADSGSKYPQMATEPAGSFVMDEK